MAAQPNPKGTVHMPASRLRSLPAKVAVALPLRFTTPQQAVVHLHGAKRLARAVYGQQGDVASLPVFSTHPEDAACAPLTGQAVAPLPPTLVLSVRKTRDKQSGVSSVSAELTGIVHHAFNFRQLPDLCFSGAAHAVQLPQQGELLNAIGRGARTSFRSSALCGRGDDALGTLPDRDGPLALPAHVLGVCDYLPVGHRLLPVRAPLDYKFVGAPCEAGEVIAPRGVPYSLQETVFDLHQEGAAVPGQPLELPPGDVWRGIHLPVVLSVLRVLFSLTPLWQGVDLDTIFALALPDSNRAWRTALRGVAYNLNRVPFRHTWARLGFDPRRHAESVLHQTVEVHRPHRRSHATGSGAATAPQMHSSMAKAGTELCFAAGLLGEGKQGCTFTVCGALAEPGVVAVPLTSQSAGGVFEPPLAAAETPQVRTCGTEGTLMHALLTGRAVVSDTLELEQDDVELFTNAAAKARASMRPGQAADDIASQCSTLASFFSALVAPLRSEQAVMPSLASLQLVADTVALQVCPAHQDACLQVLAPVTSEWNGRQGFLTKDTEEELRARLARVAFGTAEGVAPPFHLWRSPPKA